MASNIPAIGIIVIIPSMLLILFIFYPIFNVVPPDSAAGQQDNMPEVLTVQITSPQKEQLVPAYNGTVSNNTLVISGTASDNADSPCEVSVILNKVRPYQPATPTGASGKDDFSNWQFLLTPDYAPINQGANKITAKLECLKSPENLTKWYSVSVVGATQEELLLQEQQLERQRLEQERMEQLALREMQLERQRQEQMIERAKANAAKINQTELFVTFESLVQNQLVPIGELTVFGTSSDDTTTDCEVYIDVNDLKPLQKTNPSGSTNNNINLGNTTSADDYSNWTYTFTKEYHEIANGTNELTAKLDCLAFPNNYTKFFSVNVTGVTQEQVLQQQQEEQLQQQQMIERAKANAAKINQTELFVAIESHAENQSVPIDSNLTIFGTSTDDATTECDVSVVLNSKTPYQRSLPINDSGTNNDYSNWTFTFTPSYGVPVEGENEMTSRISCLAFPNNYTKFFSVNVTGVTQEQVLQQQQEEQLQQQQMIERAKVNAAKINQTELFVAIESHKPGQHVPIDSNLTIFGTSTDDATTECDVSVVLNSKTPYQRSLPVNDSGTNNDYSNWTFTFTPSYGVPVEGENEMTSRISCLAFPNNYTKFFSINVTGVAQDSLSLQQQQTAFQQPQEEIQQQTQQQPLVQQEEKQPNPILTISNSSVIPLSLFGSGYTIDNTATHYIQVLYMQ